MVLITDGLPTNNKANVPNPTCDACKTEARAEADLAKAADISIVTVGVRTASYNEQLLGQIASPEMFFSVTGDYDELYTEIKEVNKAANSCIQMARTESPTPCGEDECGVLCGPGKYLYCDGLRVCNPAHCRRSKPVVKMNVVSSVDLGSIYAVMDYEYATLHIAVAVSLYQFVLPWMNRDLFANIKGLAVLIGIPTQKALQRNLLKG